MIAPRVQFGIDRVVRFPGLLPRATRVGLVTNHAARLASDSTVPSRVALLDAGVPIIRLFSPEHGLSAQEADGAAVGDAVDRATGLPIISLYGDRFDPPLQSLADLDYLLFDIPDIGARFYTYIWTLSFLLEACGRTGTPLVVLDRPNPIGGALDAAEGPFLDEGRCASFIGRWRMPVRHSLTVGELALHWQATRTRRARVHVVPAEGWSRDAMWPELGIPWTATSPAITAFESALLYPGMCLFEGTNVGVGRGTERPFQLVAAPWLDPARVVESIALTPFRGVRLHEEEAVPSMAPHAGVPCPAVRVEVVDPARVRPVSLALALLVAIMRQHPRDFTWAAYPTAANPSGAGHFERLVGRRDIRPRLMDRDRPLAATTIAAWTRARRWRDEVRAHLLYG